jgi:hypothetical protein
MQSPIGDIPEWAGGFFFSFHIFKFSLTFWIPINIAIARALNCPAMEIK